jgi:hypothetical protein
MFYLFSFVALLTLNTLAWGALLKGTADFKNDLGDRPEGYVGRPKMESMKDMYWRWGDFSKRIIYVEDIYDWSDRVYKQTRTFSGWMAAIPTLLFGFRDYSCDFGKINYANDALQRQYNE